MEANQPRVGILMELCLIVEATQATSTIILDGRPWRRSEPLDVSLPEALPKYWCISYVWGDQTVPNPFDPSHLISDQTIPALEAAMKATRASEAQAFWIDSLCISQIPDRQRATLASMGFIYSCAHAVVAVLSPSTFDIITHLNPSKALEDETLQVLEQDPWVASVWTYQELVNSARTCFISMSASATSPSSSSSIVTVDEIDLLNQLGACLHNYCLLHKISGFGLRQRFPRLDTLEDTVVDLYAAGYLKRTALQVMANVDRRLTRVGQPQNYFYAMLGAVSKSPSWDTHNNTLEELSERFMELCEAKGGFSFLYSATERDKRPGKRWRPKPGPMKSILSWHCYGPFQGGHYDSSGNFWLQDMVELSLSMALDEEEKRQIAKTFLMTEVVSDLSDETLAQAVYEALVIAGFTGGEDSIIVKHGLFYSQTPLPDLKTAKLLRSGSVLWPFGAPGLVIGQGVENFSIIPGVFVGNNQEGTACSVLIDRLDS